LDPSLNVLTEMKKQEVMGVFLSSPPLLVLHLYDIPRPEIQEQQHLLDKTFIVSFVPHIQPIFVYDFDLHVIFPHIPRLLRYVLKNLRADLPSKWGL
jgi:hypothetical protein